MVITYLSIGEAEDYRFYWNKKKLSNIEQKVGETWQGKVITNDTNLNIRTWEKVDE